MNIYCINENEIVVFDCVQCNPSSPCWLLRASNMLVQSVIENDVQTYHLYGNLLAVFYVNVRICYILWLKTFIFNFYYCF